MEDKELYNPQNGEVIKSKRPKQFWKDWRFYVYTLIAIMLAIVSFSSCLTACAAINAGVGSSENSGFVQERKGLKTTTDRGGYDKYYFELDADFSSLDSNYYRVAVYDFDVTTCTPTLDSTSDVSFPNGTEANVRSLINTQFNGLSVSPDGVKVLALIGRTTYYGGSGIFAWAYFTFKQGAVPLSETTPIEWYNFIDISSFQFPIGLWLSRAGYAWSYPKRYNNPLILTYEKNDVLLFGGADASSLMVRKFQDVRSYYLEQGYSTGYDAGDSAGYESGHSAGYNEGYASGNADGYASGYEQATQDYQTGIAFTSYGLYANAQLTLTTDEVIGNYSYMYLFKYVTSNYDEHTVYVLFTQNSSTSQYLGYVLDRNDSDDSTSAVTLGSFSAQSSLAVTITAEQDQYFELYTGFVTSFYDRGSEVIEAVWFSGGTSQTALQNYQDGYDTGYQDGVSAGYGSGYDAGYRVGEVAGINQAEPEVLTNTLVAVFQQPFNQIYRFFNFNILGLNVLGLATGLLSVFIIIKVFKKVLK